jgi:hypothetical protein
MGEYQLNNPVTVNSSVDIKQNWKCIGGCDGSLITNESGKLVIKAKADGTAIQAESLNTFLDGVFVLDVEKIPKMCGSRAFVSLIDGSGNRIDIINQINELDQNTFEFLPNCEQKITEVHGVGEGGLYVCQVTEQDIKYWFIEKGSEEYRALRDASTRAIITDSQVVLDPNDPLSNSKVVLDRVPDRALFNNCIGNPIAPYRLYIGISYCENLTTPCTTNKTWGSKEECLENITYDPLQLEWIINSIKFYGDTYGPMDVMDSQTRGWERIRLPEDANVSYPGTVPTRPEQPPQEDTQLGEVITESAERIVEEARETVEALQDAADQAVSQQATGQPGSGTTTVPAAEPIDDDIRIVGIILGSYIGMILLIFIFMKIFKVSDS